MTPAQARDVALEAAGAASALLAEAWRRPMQVRSKSHPTDLVTEWDARIEELLTHELTRRAPGVPVLGEELGGQGGAADARWIVDPVDGTVNFAHGLPIFAVSIGYEEGGELLAGVVAAPALGWMFAAARGEGATRNGEPIHVSDVPTLDRALLVTGFPYDSRVAANNNFDAFVHMQRTAGGVRRLGSAALDLCFVAAGWLDGYWEQKLAPWDLAAGAVLVTEAGGRVTAVDGGPFDLQRGSLLASNGLLHDEMAGHLIKAGR